MGLFELEKVRSKGDMVERFAVSVGPMGWKPQGVRIVTIQISKNETYLWKAVQVLSLAAFKQGLQSHLQEMLLKESLPEAAGLGAVSDISKHLPTLNILLTIRCPDFSYSVCNVVFQDFVDNSVFPLCLPSMVSWTSPPFPAPNLPSSYTGLAFVCLFSCAFTRLSNSVSTQPVCSSRGRCTTTWQQKRMLPPFISDTLLGGSQCLGFSFPQWCAGWRVQRDAPMNLMFPTSTAPLASHLPLVTCLKHILRCLVLNPLRLPCCLRIMMASYNSFSWECWLT